MLDFLRSVARYADEAGEKARRVCKRGRPYRSGSNLARFGAHEHDPG